MTTVYEANRQYEERKRLLQSTDAHIDMAVALTQVTKMLRCIQAAQHLHTLLLLELVPHSDTRKAILTQYIDKMKEIADEKETDK